MADSPVNSQYANPLYEDVVKDIADRSKWASIDAEIVKRRLCERPSKKVKPYKGAPNTVVPIVDDVTTALTNQEITLLMNAPLMAYAIPLGKMDPALKAKLEHGFDTFLRYICRARPKLDEADDTKNARGFSDVKVVRTTDPRFGEIPNFDTIDPRDVVVPTTTKEIQAAERIVHILRKTPRQMRELAKSKGWKNVEEVIKRAKTEEESASEQKSVLDTTKHLIGVTTSGKNTEFVVVWENWHYATEWTVKQDKTGEVQLGRKACVVYSPDAPDLILACYAWKERDNLVQLSPQEMQAEQMLAFAENRPPNPTKTIPGEDRPWPFIQPRAENRSRYYYDARGVGHKCMDDQIVATAVTNSKLAWIDYVGNPMYKTTGETNNSSNFTAEPGAIMPPGMEIASPPSIPPAIDFTVDLYKRQAAQRMGAGNQYIYSENVSESRKLQKTATEVEYDQSNVSQMSSTSVDRFNDPWAELFQQLYEDLKRMQKVIPIIVNGQYAGESGTEIYSVPVLMVPASSAKTLHPEIEFRRKAQALALAAQYQQFGVAADFDRGVKLAIAGIDPRFADELLFDPQKMGPQGQPPVYQVVKAVGDKQIALEQAVTSVADIVDQAKKEITALQKLSLQHDDKLMGGADAPPAEKSRAYPENRSGG